MNIQYCVIASQIIHKEVHLFFDRLIVNQTNFLRVISDAIK